MIKHKPSSSPLTGCVLIVFLTASLAGCGSNRCFLPQSQVASFPAHGSPLAGSPLAAFVSRKPASCSPDCESKIPWPTEGSARELAQRFLTLACSLSEADDPRSTDYYFQAAVLSWQAVAEPSNCNVSESCAWRTYQSSLAGLITESNRFGRIQQGHLRVYQADGPRDISLVSSGLPFPVEEYSDLQVANKSKHGKLKHHYASSGLGVPVVAIRRRPQVAGHDGEGTVEQFIPPSLPSAATVILRPRHGDETHATNEPGGDFVLDLANPLQMNAVRVGARELTIARDITAPLEKLLELHPSMPITGFILPGSDTSDDGLKWLEPYQPGKIPVVFVHGLLSDPTTWMDMVNELRTHDWFNEQYQVWGFSYATGSPFLASAMELRVQLRDARCRIDADSQDAALQQMVLVGHSMGGLVAKLQVTDSENRVWDSISRVPLDSLRASEEVKRNLSQRLYFTSQPFVTRVVYIATPHQGSSLAVRGVGRISSALVRPDDLQQARHRKLINDNPDAFFGAFRRRIPTSIDLLEPRDCTLQAIYNLRVPERVVQHSIVGTGKGPWSLGRSDGVVSLESAHHPESVSKVSVPAAHTQITRDPDTICEVTRILQLHLSAAGTELPTRFTLHCDTAHFDTAVWRQR